MSCTLTKKVNSSTITSHVKMLRNAFARFETELGHIVTSVVAKE